MTSDGEIGWTCGEMKSLKGCFMIVVAKHQAEKAGKMETIKVSGQLVKLQVVRRRSMPEECFSFVAEDLRRHEESKVMMGSVEKERREVS